MKPCLKQHGIGDRQLGVGLVDLLVAMLISLLLLAGIGQIYVSSRAANEYSDNLSRLNENARFAISLLTKNLRMAGHLPCEPLRFSSVVSDSAINDFIDFSRSIEGVDQVSDAAADDWYAGAVDGTDALKIIFSGDKEDRSFTVQSHVPGSAAIKLSSSMHSFKEGMYITVCDSEHGALFQNSSSPKWGYDLFHEAGGGGNCTANLGYPTECGSGRGHTFSEGSQVAELQGRVFYIGASKSGAGRSLYQRPLSFEGKSGIYTADKEELVEDVENLQLLYGIDSTADDDSVPDRYVRADSVTDWSRVVAVQLWVIVSTNKALRDFTDENSYGSEGYVIGGEHEVPIPPGAEEKYRVVLSSTIQLRNRVL
ncbi:MAG: PilW family protein [Sedimenticola sp.]